MSKAIGASHQIKPVGSRILVRLMQRSQLASGLSLPENIEPEFASWAEIVALPEHNVNPYIKHMKVGDLVAFMFFSKDKIETPDGSEQFLVLEVESKATGLKGQVIAHMKGKSNAKGK